MVQGTAEIRTINSQKIIGQGNNNVIRLKMKVEGNVSTEIVEEQEEEKFIETVLGMARCPKCHRKGEVNVWIMYNKGKIRTSLMIFHKSRKDMPPCELPIELEDRNTAIVNPSLYKPRNRR